MTVRAGRFAAGLLLSLTALFVAAVPSAAVAPSVRVDPAAVSIGQTVTVTLTGWPSQRAVVISVCGNEARRGSVDCDLAGSQGYGISQFDKLHVTTFAVGTPPAPCPCVIQVANTTQTEVAYAPITINGIATAPVVGNEFFEPLTVVAHVRRAPQNPLTWMRSFLGGPTAYTVHVIVHNRSGGSVEGVKLIARAGRRKTDQARRVVLPAPGRLIAGQTWTHAQRVTLSAPVIGGFVWTVTASGDAAVAHDTVTTDHQPYGLYLVVLALVGDLGWWGYRRVRRLRTRVDESVEPPAPSDAESRLARPIGPKDEGI